MTFNPSKRTDELLRAYPTVKIAGSVKTLLTCNGKMNSFMLFRKNFSNLHKGQRLGLVKVSIMAGHEWNRLGSEKKFWKELAKIVTVKNKTRQLVQNLRVYGDCDLQEAISEHANPARHDSDNSYFGSSVGGVTENEVDPPSAPTTNAGDPHLDPDKRNPAPACETVFIDNVVEEALPNVGGYNIHPLYWEWDGNPQIWNL